ncbi:FAD:protein FMN transferase [Tritonibacter litoralis]|nr:FAD:protein FMN transferase [Tritonibacter litoralis]
MGTTYNVVAIDHSNKLKESDVKTAISEALATVNASMSNWDQTSEISRINAEKTDRMTTLSPELAQVMEAAAFVNQASGGRFDTTVGPLIELWGFGAPGAQSMPSEGAVADARAKSGHENTLRIGAGTLQKTQADAQIYLAAIGKGYGADHVGRALEQLGVNDYLVEIGGDLYAAGRNPDGLPWQIGIEAPNAADRGVLGVVGLSGLGLASSGDYRNYFEVDGQRYSHLIDPATGRPVDHKTASATVLAENAMLADAWSTAMLILGRERGLEVAAQHGIAVQFAERDPSVTALQFKTYASEAFKTLAA